MFALTIDGILNSRCSKMANPCPVILMRLLSILTGASVKNFLSSSLY